MKRFVRQCFVIMLVFMMCINTVSTTNVYAVEAEIPVEETDRSHEEQVIPENESMPVETYSFYGSIYVDKNKNSIKEDTEPGLPDICVRLYDNSGHEISHVMSDGAGKYVFDQLDRGSYHVTFESADPDISLETMEFDTQMFSVNDKTIKSQVFDINENKVLDIGFREKNEQIEKSEDKKQKKELKNTSKVYTDAMTFEELSHMEKDIAGSALEITPINRMKEHPVFPSSGLKFNNDSIPFIGSAKTMNRSVSPEGNPWSFDVYYVNQDDRYHVAKEDDFLLKYQMEFHTDKNIEAKQVQIRIPYNLPIMRDGSEIKPVDIAVPEADSMEEPVESKVTPFNYYYDDETNELVFFNYEPMMTGTNVAWQVLYKNITIMELRDGSSWKLEPRIDVTYYDIISHLEDEREYTDCPEMSSTPLTGDIDSMVKLTKVTKEPYDETKGPDLYTESQVSSVIDKKLPDEFSGEFFNNYKYVAWEIEVEGYATQPWNLKLNEKALTGDKDGKIVGMTVQYRDGRKAHVNVSKPETIDGQKYLLAGSALYIREFEKSIEKIVVVAAYPNEDGSIKPGTVLENDVIVRVEPIDQIDPIQEKNAHSQWAYHDYDWQYRGNTIGIQKRNVTSKIEERKRKPYKAFLDAYSVAQSKSEDIGKFVFDVYSTTYGYGFTHEVLDKKKLGEYKEGTYYDVTTVDDYIYAFHSKSGKHWIMDDRDYYFNSVEITTTDIGYDPWEGSTAIPEMPSSEINNSDLTSTGMKIYVMYHGSQEWEYVDTVEWNESGVMKYTMPLDKLEGQPWRVKVEHRGINYHTGCQMNLSVRLRHDSPVMKELLSQYGEEEYKEISLENISGVIGTRKDGQFFHDDRADNGNYEEPELIENSQNLYGTLPMRDNAIAILSSLEKDSRLVKTFEQKNDPVNGVVQLQYNIAGYEGYEIYDEETYKYIREGEGRLINKPDCKEIVFYDLLPYGMKFDPSYPIIAGRLKDGIMSSKLWDTTQVRVSIDPDKDIITDYNGTGRTRIAFHVRYEGADPSVFTEQKWIEGFGVSFGAYFEWKDLKMMQNTYNVAAYMHEDNDIPILGKSTTVKKDDGKSFPQNVYDEYIKFGNDIDKDGSQDDDVMFAAIDYNEDIATASSNEIVKSVRADTDRFGIFKNHATAILGHTYTYQINISNAQNESKDIIIFDQLENEPLPYDHDEKRWYGTFEQIRLEGLEKIGAVPEVWYNKDRDAKLPEKEADFNDALNILNDASHGWVKAEEWTLDKADVKAVAVILYKDKEHTDTFKLDAMQSLNMQIQMRAPEKLPEAKLACNKTEYLSYLIENEVSNFRQSNLVTVDLGDGQTLEVIKTFEGNIPEKCEDTSFQFQAVQMINNSTVPLSAREYKLYKLTDSEWILQDNKIYATDSKGYFYLKADEKVVFELETLNGVDIKEEENPFWKVDVEKTKDSNKTTWTYKNSYHPVLFIQKQVRSYPGEPTDIKDKFIMTVYDQNNQPVKNNRYWIVDSIELNGGVPNKLGEGVTDENGSFKIGANQIIALPLSENQTYHVVENDSGEDWIVEKEAFDIELPIEGASATFTNIYKWKDLLITKKITHQKADEAKDQTFTFQICDEEDQPITTKNEWVVLNSLGHETNESGQLDSNGTVTGQFAGKTIKIKNMEARKSYIVKEVDSGENYKPVQDKVEAEIPLYATASKVTFTNDYLLRPISVKKIVTYSDNISETEREHMRNKEFSMQILVNGNPFANKPYIVKSGHETREALTDANGYFMIKDGETVTFEDVGKEGTPYKIIETQDDEYIQIYPSNSQPHEDKIGNEGSEVTFINGSSSQFMIGKEYMGANIEGIKFVEEIMKENPENYSVGFILQRQDDSGKWNTINENLDVRVVDTLTGEMTRSTLTLNKEFSMLPWQKIMIPFDEDVKYRLQETKQYQYQLFDHILKDENNKTIANIFESVQKEPANNKYIEGTVRDNPMALIINEVRGVTYESTIFKKMSLGSSEVNSGSKLVLQVEQYTNGRWKPAQDIPYLVADDSGNHDERIRKTDANGYITIYKSETGYPVIHFTNHDIKVNPKNIQEGNYRIIERIDESDEEWGYLSGYASENEEMIENLDGHDGTVFFNSNRTSKFIIEKTTPQPTDEIFTFELKQIVSSSKIPIQNVEDILESVPGINVQYDVYDKETDKFISSEVSNEQGHIYLKSGQYAKVHVSDKTIWTVHEVQDTLFHLETIDTFEAQKLNDNETTVVIQAKEEKIPVKLIVECTKSYFLPGETFTFDEFKNLFNVSILYSDGTKEGNIMNYIISEYEGVDTITLTETINLEFKYEKLYTTSQVLVATGTTITKDDVINGVIDYTTGEKVILNKGDVVIPEIIVTEDGPKIVTGIEEKAFGNSSSLQANKDITSITLPDTITEIGDYAFAGCDNLTGDLILPDNLTSIGNNAFTGCDGLTGDLIIPDSVTSIGDEAFYECYGFDGSLILPDGLTSIGANAFYRCQGFTGDLIIPDSVTSVGSYAFYGCIGFDGKLVISKNLTSIEDFVFAMCYGLTGELIIPDSVISIGVSSFNCCSEFTKLILGNNITSIGEGAFALCEKIEGELIIPEGITNIEDYTFNSCTGLIGTLVIPKHITRIGNGAFSECSGFTGLILENGIVNIGEKSFSSCRNLKGGLDIPDTVTNIGKGAFEYCRFSNLKIGKGLSNIDDYVFTRCGFTEVDIPDNIISVGDFAFSSCMNLTGLTLGNNVTSIGKRAFYNCNIKGELLIPASMISIGDEAFSNNYNIDYITVNKPKDSILGAPWGYKGNVYWTEQEE